MANFLLIYPTDVSVVQRLEVEDRFDLDKILRQLVSLGLEKEEEKEIRDHFKETYSERYLKIRLSGRDWAIVKLGD